MQALNIDVATHETQMAVVPMSEYIGLKEQLEEVVEQRIHERNREQGIPHIQLHRVIRGENPIKVYREWRKLTQSKLAEICEVTQGNIAIIERFDNIGSTPLLLKISQALNVDFEHIAQYQCEGHEEKHKQLD